MVVEPPARCQVLFFPSPGSGLFFGSFAGIGFALRAPFRFPLLASLRAQGAGRFTLGAPLCEFTLCLGAVNGGTRTLRAVFGRG